MRGAHAAGRLSVGFWDHWVPGANDVMRKIVQEWADKEKVDVSADFITSTGDKLRITIAAEAQAGSGHDVLAMSTWLPASYADKLEPVDDVVKSLIQQGGDVGKTVEYLGQANGRWIAVPTTSGRRPSRPAAASTCSRSIVGLDITQMYPAGGQPSKELTDRWTWDFFLEAAEKLNKAGHPFGMPMGPTSDAVDWVGAVFAAYGAQFVDEKGNITIKSDATRQVLDWFKKLVPNLPPDVFAWDDASNNKALVSGKSALIMNPPSAWAVAKRDAPQVAQNLWTFGPPKGPKGRMMPFLPYYWTIWKFSSNKPAAKSAADLSAAGDRRSSGWSRRAWATTSRPIASSTTSTSGRRSGRPRARSTAIRRATRTRSPRSRWRRRRRRSRCRCTRRRPCTKMIAQCTQQGKSIDQAIAWAADEIEGFMRG